MVISNVQDAQKSIYKQDEVIQQARGLIFANEPARAIAVLREFFVPEPSGIVNENIHPVQVMRWYGIAQMSDGRLKEAKNTLMACVVRDDKDSTGPLAATQRLLGESTTWLLELPELFIAGFERAFWEKETACVYWSQERYTDATEWLERAWKSAHESEYGHGIFAAISQALGQSLRILGRDNRAITILDKGIQYAHATRRAPLLFERGISNFNLMRLAAVEEDLMELQMQPAGYKSFSKFLEGCLFFGRGMLGKASDTFQDARELGHEEENDEMIFYANLYTSQVRIEMQILESKNIDIDPITNTVDAWGAKSVHGAELFIRIAEEVAEDSRQNSYLELLKALLNVRNNNQKEAFIQVTFALAEFRSTNMLREASFAALVLAEHYLSIDDTEHVSKVLSLVVQMVLEIGNNSGLVIPLRLLPLVRAHLAALPEDSEFRSILAEPNAFKTLHVFADRLEIDANRVRTKRSKTIDLIRFMTNFEDGLTLEEILNTFFEGVDRESAKSLFHVLRKDVTDSVPGLLISLNQANNRYTIMQTQYLILVKSA